jgi:hypothetical protein
MINGRNISFNIRNTQSLRLLALWYPNVVSYEQIYYNLSFCVNKIFASANENPKMWKYYLFGIIDCVQARLKSGTEGNYIDSFSGKEYRLVCRSNRQACPNESFVQGTLHF